MIARDRSHSLESVIALQKALDTSIKADISPNESADNIESHTVTLVGSESPIPFQIVEGKVVANLGEIPPGIGSGIFLTSDFVLTAKHVAGEVKKLQPYLNETFFDTLAEGKIPPQMYHFLIVDSKGTAYFVDPTVPIDSELTDTALLRIISPYKSEPMRYNKFFGEFKPGQKLGIVGALEDYSIKKENTRVISPSQKIDTPDKPFISDCFTCEVAGKPGYSGGPFLTERGEFAGILTKGGPDMIGGSKALNIYHELERESELFVRNVLKGTQRETYIPLAPLVAIGRP